MSPVAQINARKPLGSVQPDTRGRVSLIKFLPAAPGLYLIYANPETGVIELHPLNQEGSAAA